MNEYVFWNLETTIKPGQNDNLIALMKEMVANTEANEPGTLNYEWSIGEDNETMHLYERYVDSAAAMNHSGTFAEKFAERFMAALDVKRFVVYGNPSDELKQAMSGMGVVYMRPIGGFAR